MINILHSQSQVSHINSPRRTCSVCSPPRVTQTSRALQTSQSAGYISKPPTPHLTSAILTVILCHRRSPAGIKWSGRRCLELLSSSCLPGKRCGTEVYNWQQLRCDGRPPDTSRTRYVYSCCPGICDPTTDGVHRFNVCCSQGRPLRD
jgi:hypothetical protein